MFVQRNCPELRARIPGGQNLTGHMPAWAKLAKTPRCFDVAVCSQMHTPGFI